MRVVDRRQRAAGVGRAIGDAADGRRQHPTPFLAPRLRPAVAGNEHDATAGVDHRAKSRADGAARRIDLVQYDERAAIEVARRQLVHSFLIDAERRAIADGKGPTQEQSLVRAWVRRLDDEHRNRFVRRDRETSTSFCVNESGVIRTAPFVAPLGTAMDVKPPAARRAPRRLLASSGRLARRSRASPTRLGCRTGVDQPRRDRHVIAFAGAVATRRDLRNRDISRRRPAEVDGRDCGPRGKLISLRFAQPIFWKSEMSTTSRRGRLDAEMICDASLSAGA